jgi:hypothetical protein
MEQIQALRFDV